MTLFDRIIDRATTPLALRLWARSTRELKRIADALERAHPPLRVELMTVEAVDEVDEGEPVVDESEGLGDADVEGDFLKVMHHRMQAEREKE